MTDEKRKRQREALNRPPWSTSATDNPSRAFRGGRQVMDLLRNKPWIRGEASREQMGLPVRPEPVEPVAPEPAGPPAPAGFTTEPAFPRGVPGMGPPTAREQRLDSMRTDLQTDLQNTGRDQTISPPVPPRPPTTLNDSATNTFPTAPDNSVFEAQAANVPSLDTGDDPRRGRGSDIPGGFTQIIRGTDVTFQGPEAGGREFRALPGMSLEESQRMAAAESPGFQFLDKQDVERQRVNASNMQAEAQRTQSIYGNTKVGRNANGFPSLILPDGKGGYNEIQDFSPQLTQAASQTGRFEFGKVESAGGGLPDTYVLDTAAGTTRNLTKEMAAGLSLVQVEAKAKEDFGIDNYADLSKDQLDELLDDLELPPEIEAAVRLAQRNIQAEPEPAGPPT